MLTGCPTCTQVGERAALGRPPVERPGAGTTLLATVRRIDGRTAATVVVAGTAVGFLTGLFGVGGGFVIVPALALGLKLPMPEAIGTSLLVVALNSAVALVARFATTGIDWQVTLPFTVSAVLGVLAGSKVADRIDAHRTLRWFAGLLVAVAAYTAIKAGTALLA
jgi:uncharacterized membrane protein YfcA